MKKYAFALTLICLGSAALADEKPVPLLEACQTDVKGDKKDEWTRLPKADKLFCKPSRSELL